MNLRPYQIDATKKIREAFLNGKKIVIICLPTGGGKTVVFSDIVAQTAKRGKRVAILTNRIELLTQAGGSIQRLGINYEIIDAKSKTIDTSKRVFVAMVETFFRRLKWYPQLRNIELLIIDEAHIGSFKKIFAEISPNTFVIGATATPIATSKADPLKNYYNSCINPVQIQELIDQGFLCECFTFSAKINQDALELDNKGEYTDESQRKALYSGVVEKYEQFAKGTKTICFNINVAHSIQVSKEFEDAGYLSAHIDGETPEHERKRIINAFKRGEIQILNNVGILNAGFDDPATKTIIVNRATTSVSLWLQMAGRGSRPHPESGKEHFTLIDMGGNWARLGLWEMERDWVKMFNTPPKKKSEGAAPVKSCPSCEAILPASAKICKYCEHVFEVKERQTVEAQFVQVNAPKKPWSEQTIEELALTKNIKKYKFGWLMRQIKERSKDFDEFENNLLYLAKINGYKSGWVKHQLSNYKAL